MARALGVATALLVATAALAGPCEEERARIGVALANRDGALVVAEVDPGSPAAQAGLRSDDVVLQMNATVPTSCVDWAKVVRDARDGGKAVLLLVERGGAQTPLVIGAGAWVPPPLAEAAPGPGGTMPPRPTPPPVAPRTPPATIVAPPPPPLPDEVPVAVDAIVRGIASLAPAERPPTSLSEYERRLADLHQQVETLAVRRAAPPEQLTALRDVLRYFDAAAIAWKATEAERERTRLARHLPMPEEATAPYFEESSEALVIEQFPFLAGTVAREPKPGRFTESSGAWRAIQARAILWAHGREELARLEGRLGIAAP